MLSFSNSKMPPYIPVNEPSSRKSMVQLGNKFLAFFILDVECRAIAGLPSMTGGKTVGLLTKGRYLFGIY
jgi:hypothetical protein